MSNNFRTLDLAIEFYHQTTALALKGAIRDQLNRAALSISLNLAEGSGRAGEHKRWKIDRFFLPVSEKRIGKGVPSNCQNIKIGRS